MGEFEDYLKENGIIHKITASYSPEQSRRAERVNRTIMGSARAILAQQKLLKSLWADIAKAVVYLRNRNLINQGRTTVYKNLKSEKPYLGHLWVLGCWVWVNISKKKCKKLDGRSYQGIHVGYEGTNQYRIYDSHNGQVSITRDMYFDKAHHYDKKDFQPHDFADNQWDKEDDELFADPINIVDVIEPMPEYTTIRWERYNAEESRSSSPLSDIPDLLGDQEEESHLQLNRGDSDFSIQPPATLAFLVTSAPDITSTRSRQNCLTDPTPGIQQSTCLNNQPSTSANIIRSVSVTSLVPKSHIHMIAILANLYARYDDLGPDKPLSLKETMTSPYWQDFKKSMHAQFQSLIENNTWEYRDAPSGRAVLMGR